MLNKNDNSRIIETYKHLYSIEGAITIPLLQSTITGISISILIVVILIVLGAPVITSIGIAGIMLAACFVLSWFIFQRKRDYTLWKIEEFLNIDINADGAIGEPKRVRVDFVDRTDRYLKAKFATFDMTIEVAAKMAKRLLDGVPFSERHWTGKNGMFTDSEFATVRETFLKNGWAYWKNEKHPQQGMEISSAGRAVLRSFIKRNRPTE